MNLKVLIQNYKKKILITLIATVFSFTFKFILIEMFDVSWDTTLIFTTIVLMHIGFYLDYKFKYGAKGKIFKNYLKKTSSTLLTMLLSLFLWYILIEIIGMHWISTYFISGIIVAGITFNSAFIYEYLIGYQNKKC